MAYEVIFGLIRFFVIDVFALTVGPWADVKNDFTWKIIIVLKVRGGNGELKFS